MKNQSRYYQDLAYNLARTHTQDSVTLVIAPNQNIGHFVYENLKFWCPKDLPIYWFSEWETLPYDQYTPHPDLISERLRVLSEIPNLQSGIIVSSIHAMMQRLCPQSHLDKFGLHIKTGLKIKQEKFINRLLQAGYQKNTFLAEKGEYAKRGNIVDLFPMGAAEPIRLEWVDDEIDTIRTFDLQTQNTISKKTKISILPSREIDLSEAGRVCFRQSSRLLLGEKFINSGIYQSLSKGRTPQGLEYYLPLFFDETSDIFHYLPAKTQYIGCDNLQDEITNFQNYCQKRYDRLNSMREKTLLSPGKLWLNLEEFNQQMEALMPATIHNKCQTIDFQGLSDERDKKWTDVLSKADLSCLHFHNTGIREFWHEKLYKSHETPKIVDTHWSFPNADSADKIQLFISPINHSFIADGITHLAERDLHAAATNYDYRKNQQKNAGEIIRSLKELNIGSPVVHVDYGVGRYQGLETLDDEEMLIIEYAKNVKLFVNIDDLDLISKYSGVTEDAPLHEIGGKVWQKIREKAQHDAYDVAGELLAIYAAREASNGQQIIYDPQLLKTFSDKFIYDETPDQLQAINAVLDDLQQKSSMDRIICGDVGFGKTEVAMRAAFAAVSAGYQVAMISPTTLLTEQHQQNFSDRFSDFAIQIDSLSRFKSSKLQQEVINKLRKGTLDIIIGTHRLLQNDIEFKNLGLVIIDEEQRFGVKHKEKLKTLRADVNLLTLTATPIPRTLNLALSGLRDLSIIATAPSGRQSIQTMLCVYDVNVIEEACERELSRGGQIFFLHNDVRSIKKTARSLSELLPDANIAVAHGQMTEKNLETIMQAFYNRHYDILVASTIIESGIDIPNANTIIINHADKLGLSQLHQLRGRVGRSHHQAYAYLIIPDFNSLNKDAQKRLEAFSSLDSLGAGFLLASQDLEIRGAGEILGDEQSGQIQQIGMSYYLDLLENATKAIKEGKTLSTEIKDERLDIETNFPAFIDSNYIFDPQIRLGLYQEISQVKTSEDLDQLKIKLIDTYGSLPQVTQQLFVKSLLKLKAISIGIKALKIKDKYIHLSFKTDAKINPDKFFKSLQENPKVFNMRGPSEISILITDNDPIEMVNHLMQWLDSIQK